MKMLTVPNCFLLQLVLCALVWAQSGGFTVQVASLPAEAEAQAMVKNLQAKGLESYWTRGEVAGIGTRYRVHLGRFATREEARQQAEQARRRGLIKEFIIIAAQPAASGAELSRRETKPPASKPSASKPSASKPPAAEPKAKRISEAPAASASLSPKPESLARAEETVAAASNKTEAEPVAEAKKGDPASASGETMDALAARDRRTVPPQSVTRPPAQAQSGKTRTAAALAPVSREEPPPGKTPASTSRNTIAAPPAPIEVAISDERWEVVRRGPLAEPHLRAVHFVDSLTGWAAGDGGLLYRTTDGGRAWKPLTIGLSVSIARIFFVDWNTGWMLGDAPGKESAPPQTVLLRTANGGRTWARQPLPGVLGFHFADARTGWAVGHDAALLKTSDGGAEWKQYEGIEKLIGLPVESTTYNFGFCDVHFIDGARGWAIGNFYGRARNHLGGLFATTDGGATWQRVPLSVKTQHSSSRFTPGLLHTVRFTDLGTGTVTGEMQDGEERYFFALHTQDGGKTWQQARVPGRTAQRAHFLNPAYGWLAAVTPRKQQSAETSYDTSLKRTADGGASWQEAFTARGGQIRAVFFLAPTKGWAVGDHGLILRYEDRGK
jgi:photosystem II stability/assembly factor-like uncharacterized protein